MITHSTRSQSTDHFEPRPFQQAILDIVSETPDDRKIYWISDTRGNTGKTQLARYLCSSRNDVLYISGTGKDLEHAVARMVKKGKPPQIILFDIWFGAKPFDYGTIEGIKDGLFFSSRYRSHTVIFDKPHVFIFSNLKPELRNCSSEDRWIVYSIDEQYNLTV